MEDGSDTTSTTTQTDPATVETAVSEPAVLETAVLEPAVTQVRYKPDPADAARQAAREAKGKRHIGFGIAWLVAGVLITVITYAQAAGGGVYVVAWGPMVYGIYRIVSGARLLNANADTSTSTNANAYDGSNP
ncbi:hypothetical protein [Streptacidiphilus fuscans]|uniref:Uncharacterized protein n=1 Tax=Streptacidiphilus fuscans TaxID=2789292 RepID=A0A931B7P8_9ACTN|nr:hypothetical protein [Streptacidiphilus fuscans]MBF9072644.1 hypothetical protein [Streptacidiphilus fuscans]